MVAPETRVMVEFRRTGDVRICGSNGVRAGYILEPLDSG